jgi:NAD(P)-dependent dehydrogenase (short-subunit alcohol dehydrogenase family)
MDLHDKVMVITGGAQGIGEATARLCAGRGARVIIADVKQEAGERAAASIRQNGGEACFERVDVRDDAEVQALMAGVGERHGRLDVLICAAGVLKGAFVRPEAFPLGDFTDVMDINVTGTFLCVKHATPFLVASKHGVVILIASGAGVAGPSSSLAYGASKGGVNGLGMTLAHHLAPRGVRVNVVCPSNIATEMKLGVVVAQAQREGSSPEEAVARARQEFGSPDGVAHVLAFLASDEADYVRGTIFTR